MNTLLRSVTEVDTETAGWLREPHCVKLGSLLSEESIKALMQAGILVEDDEADFVAFREWLQRIQFDFTNIKAVIILTSRCNLDCTYCFEKGILLERCLDMTDQVVEHIISWLQKFSEQHHSEGVAIYFYGGEPALRTATMERMINGLSDRIKRNADVRFSMFTNGTILTPDLLKIIKRPDFDTVQITLDGPQNVHDRRRPFKSGNGTFEIIFGNIKRLLIESEAHVRVVLNFDSDNYESVPRLLDMFVGLEESNLEFAYNPVFVTAHNAPACRRCSLPSVQSAGIWADLYKMTLQRGFHCNPLRIFETGPCTFWRMSHLIFDPLGDIYKCIGMPGRSEHKIGNVAEGLDSQMLVRMRELIGISPWDNDRCLNCAYLPLCLGGCKFHSLEQNGNIEGVFCHKELIELCELELLKYIVFHDQENESHFDIDRTQTCYSKSLSTV